MQNNLAVCTSWEVGIYQILRRHIADTFSLSLLPEVVLLFILEVSDSNLGEVLS